MEIRKISIGPDYKNGAMHYIVGQRVISDSHEIHLIKYDGESGSYKIYVISAKNEVFLWKEFTNTVPISIEYSLLFGEG